MTRFPQTLNLAIASMVVSVLIGVPAGIISAIKQNSWFDVSSTTIALAGISIPNFWLGAMLILIFSVELQWLPVGGLSAPFWTIEGMRQLILPAITLGTASAAMIARMSRSAQRQHIGIARAVSLNPSLIVCDEAVSAELPNAADYPSGCPFHTRCPLAHEHCRQKRPEWREVKEGHFVACHEV